MLWKLYNKVDTLIMQGPTIRDCRIGIYGKPTVPIVKYLFKNGTEFTLPVTRECITKNFEYETTSLDFYTNRRAAIFGPRK